MPFFSTGVLLFLSTGVFLLPWLSRDGFHGRTSEIKVPQYTRIESLGRGAPPLPLKAVLHVTGRWRTDGIVGFIVT